MSNPSTFINAWVDGGQSSTLFDAVYANRSDVVAINAIDPTAGNAANMLVPAVTSAHGFLCDGANTWRNRLSVAQAAWAFRMQYAPDTFRERLALFWHQFFATGYDKVQNTALMVEQIQLFRDQGLGNFTDLLVAISKNPAMCVWLDSVSNSAVGSAVPNENYSREVLELYSLGVDNGYSQQDITSLAKALSGWSFYVAPSDIVSAPNNIADKYARRGTVVVSQGQTVPTGSLAWYMGALSNNRLQANILLRQRTPREALRLLLFLAGLSITRWPREEWFQGRMCFAPSPRLALLNVLNILLRELFATS